MPVSIILGTSSKLPWASKLQTNMATGGVRTLSIVVLSVVFSASCASSSDIGGKYSLSTVKWGTQSSIIIAGEPVFLKLFVSDDIIRKNLLVALSSSSLNENYTAPCSNRMSSTVRPRAVGAQGVLVHLRSYHTADLQTGNAFVCGSLDGVNWDLLGSHSNLTVIRSVFHLKVWFEFVKYFLIWYGMIEAAWKWWSWFIFISNFLNKLLKGLFNIYLFIMFCILMWLSISIFLNSVNLITFSLVQSALVIHWLFKKKFYIFLFSYYLHFPLGINYVQTW